MTIHDTLRRLREVQYAVEPEDCDGLGDELVAADGFEPLCLEIAEAAVEHELQARAVAERLAELAERKARLLRTSDTLRAVLLQAMEIRGVGSIPSPTLTLSVSRRAGDLVVTDESLLPARFFKPQPPVLDRKALKEAVVKDGEVVDGAAVGNGSVGLTIRRK